MRQGADRLAVGADDDDLLRALVAVSGCSHASILPRAPDGRTGPRRLNRSPPRSVLRMSGPAGTVPPDEGAPSCGRRSIRRGAVAAGPARAGRLRLLGLRRWLRGVEQFARPVGGSSSNAVLKTAQTATSARSSSTPTGAPSTSSTRTPPGSGTSACTGDCLAKWPAVTADSDSPDGRRRDGDVGTITRDDGTKQVTLAGMPLYSYARRLPGWGRDRTGRRRGLVGRSAPTARRSRRRGRRRPPRRRCPDTEADADPGCCRARGEPAGALRPARPGAAGLRAAAHRRRPRPGGGHRAGDAAAGLAQPRPAGRGQPARCAPGCSPWPSAWPSTPTGPAGRDRPRWGTLRSPRCRRWTRSRGPSTGSSSPTPSNSLSQEHRAVIVETYYRGRTVAEAAARARHPARAP